MISGRIMESWQWIFIFFAVLMIARIVPRMLRQRKINFLKTGNVTTQKPFFNDSRDRPFVKESKEQPSAETKPESKDMLVLGEINRGVKTFGNIQQRTGFNTDELKSILESLEKKGLMRIQEKKGALGIEIELIPTEKGYKEFQS